MFRFRSYRMFRRPSFRRPNVSTCSVPMNAIIIIRKATLSLRASAWAAEETAASIRAVFKHAEWCWLEKLYHQMSKSEGTQMQLAKIQESLQPERLVSSSANKSTSGSRKISSLVLLEISNIGSPNMIDCNLRFMHLKLTPAFDTPTILGIFCHKSRKCSKSALVCIPSV